MIYCASPYTHSDPAVVQQRFDDACRAAAFFLAQGHFIFSPIAHCHPLAMAGKLPTDWTFWEKYDREMIGACSNLWVLMLDEWQSSRGVAAEIQIARELKKPIDFIKMPGAKP